jgi:DNA-binding transcriptional ArsR family regulator
MTYHDAITALSDPRRRAIFESLRSGPKSVARIASDQPVSRPAVSQHLKILQSAGLVQVTAKGTRRIYQIRHDGLTTLRQYIDSFWQDTLDAFANHVSENPAKKEK